MIRAFLDAGWRAGVAAITVAAFLGTTPALAQAPGGAAPPPPPPGAAPPPPGAAPPPPDPNAPPPPGYGQPPPPGYGQPPPPGYGQPPPPGYGPPPPGYAPRQPPPEPDLPRVITNYEEGDPIPPGYVERGRIRKGLVIGGSVTLGSVWLLSVLTASIGYAAEEVDESLSEFDDGVTQDDWIPLFIPVVGPWVSMATLKASGAGIAILSIDGIVQAGGLAMLLAGIFAEKKILVRDYETGFDMTITPNIGPGQQGIGVFGHF